MRLLARCAAVAGLVLAGGLALPDGAAEAAACSGTSGVTVVIDYGSDSTTTCAPNSSTAMTALRTVAQVEYPVQYQGTVVCKINGVPSNQTCQRMPPASAYWAFFHARRGGSWTYSSVGAADYAPAPGTVIGFAFGAGGQPSTAPPAAAPAPKPSPKPSPKPTASSSSTHPSSTPNAARPSTPPNGSAASSAPGSSTRPSSAAPSGGATSAAGTSTTRATAGTATAAPGSAATPATGPGAEATTRDGGAATVAGASTADEGSRTTLLAGLGLVGLVGAAAAYVALRRRADG